MGLNGSAAHPRASQALSSMLSRNALNPADITNLFKLYSVPDPPPVELIRLPQFMGMTIDMFDLVHGNDFVRFATTWYLICRITS